MERWSTIFWPDAHAAWHGALALLMAAPVFSAPGDWPEPRQNGQLTAVQPLPGRLVAAPEVLGQLDFGRGAPGYTPVAAATGAGHWGIAISNGALYCFDQSGTLLWRSHPDNINFTSLASASDLDGDGVAELVLQAGRPTDPFGAAVVVGLRDGALLWRYDVEPMSYAWYLYVEDFDPETPGPEMLVVMHGYPPDPQNGYTVLFDIPDGEAVPHQRWRYDFDAFTCFPSLLRNDYDRDGVVELAIETHSRMWMLDPQTGAREAFFAWDVAPANTRSYGRIEFVDLNQDGWDDFLCIADFAQHHEVLINHEGKLEKAWSQGWAESVTTGKVATTWPEPPYGDLDGDGVLELVVSVFNGDEDGGWKTRVYDGASGAVRASIPGVAAAALHDIDGNGRVELLGNASEDPGLSALLGGRVYSLDTTGEVQLRWQDGAAVALSTRNSASKAASRVGAAVVQAVEGAVLPLVRKAGTLHQLAPGTEGGAFALMAYSAPAAPPQPVFAKVPLVSGGRVNGLFAADLFQQGRNDLLCHRGTTITAYRFDAQGLTPSGTWQSDAEPVLADLNGDGALELVTVAVDDVAPPRITAWTPAHANEVLWERQLPAPAWTGLRQSREAYLRTGRFTGKATTDLYFLAGTPVVRSMVIDGATGATVWERGETPGIERYWAPTVNLASVTDFDGDGAEDLIFTNPDYYCVASGTTGAALLGPSFPPDIFRQPSQGLYTLPALLAGGERPTVCLVGGHYFQGCMTLDAEPKWFKLPLPGENRAGAEGFLQDADGTWRMGFGRQNGNFACVDVATGAVRWEYPTGGTCSDTIAGDVDGDGTLEFVVGTSHGTLLALGDGGVAAQLIWAVQLSGGIDRLILADVDGDGASDLVVSTDDGYLQVLGNRGR